MNAITRKRKMKKRIVTVRIQKTLCCITGIAFATILLSNAKQEPKPVINFEQITQSTQQENMQPEIKYFTYEIQNGDNMWTLAKKYKLEGYNIDNMMLQIRTANKLPNNNIYTGKTLQIPYYD